MCPRKLGGNSRKEKEDSEKGDEGNSQDGDKDMFHADRLIASLESH